MSSNTSIETRTYGQFPLSIATSMAIESLMGIHPEMPPPPQPPFLKYDSLWVNVRTVFRNLYGAIEKVVRDATDVTTFTEALDTELNILQRVVEERTDGKVHVMFYLPSYVGLQKKFPHTEFKELSTPLQLAYQSLEKEVYNRISNMDHWPSTVMKRNDTTLEMDGGNSLIMTHLAVDLVVAKGYGNLTLLESHTGMFKDKYLWYTKLNGGRHLTRMPFDRMTLQVFGDSGGMFKPKPSKVRQTLQTIAETYDWTPRTTKERILLTVETAHEPILKADLIQLYSSI